MRFKTFDARAPAPRCISDNTSAPEHAIVQRAVRDKAGEPAAALDRRNNHERSSKPITSSGRRPAQSREFRWRMMEGRRPRSTRNCPRQVRDLLGGRVPPSPAIHRKRLGLLSQCDRQRGMVCVLSSVLFTRCVCVPVVGCGWVCLNSAPGSVPGNFLAERRGQADPHWQKAWKPPPPSPTPRRDR